MGPSTECNPPWSTWPTLVNIQKPTMCWAHPLNAAHRAHRRGQCSKAKKGQNSCSSRQHSGHVVFKLTTLLSFWGNDHLLAPSGGSILSLKGTVLWKFHVEKIHVLNEDSSSPEPEPRIEKASIVKHKKVKSSSVFDGGLWWRRVERSIVLLEAYKGSFFLFVGVDALLTLVPLVTLVAFSNFQLPRMFQ